jgi:MraZ protein
MARYFGRFVNKVDRKGRVSVPSRFRNQILSLGQSSMVAAPSEHDPAIDAMDVDRLNELIDRLDRPGALSAEDQARAEYMFGRAEELPIDKDGRVLLPKALLEHARIDDAAIFVGIGRSFRIWNPERHAAFEAETRAALGDEPLSLKDLARLGASDGEDQR